MTNASGRAGALRGAGLVDAYHEIAPRVYRMGARLSVDGEEVAQDVCVRVLRMDRRDEIEAPIPFLYRIARNLFVDRQRQRANERTLFAQAADLDGWGGDTPDPERVLIGKQRLEIALGAIEQLPPRCREAFTLHRFDGLTYAAVARRMGISTSMVEKHIAEAMLRLANAIRCADDAEK